MASTSECTSYLEDKDVCSPGSAFHEFCQSIRAKSAHQTHQKLLVSFTNFGYFDMAHNFVVALHKLGIYNIIMFALDLASFEKLKLLNIPTWFLSQKDAVYTEASSSFGSPEFNSICNVKPWIVLEILKGGIDVVWTDTDVIWHRDAQPFFDIHPTVDMQLQGDDDDICAGFFYARSTAANIKLLENVILYTNTWVDDQTALRRFLNETEGLAHRLTSKKHDLAMTRPEDWRVPLSFDLQPNVVNYLVLPRMLFPNGTAYFNFKFPQRFGVVPFIVHNNCIIGHDSKVDRFKMYDMWYIPSPLDVEFDETSAKFERKSPKFNLTPHREIVTCLSVHPDQSILYTASYDKTVKTYRMELIDKAQGPDLVRPSGGGLLNRRGGAWCMAWKPATVANSSNSTSSVVKPSTSATPPSRMDEVFALLQKKPVAEASNNAVQSVSEEPQCFTGGHDRHVMVWQTHRGLVEEVFANTGPWKSEITLKGHSGVVNDVLYHREQVFSASDDCTVRSWDPVKGEKTRIYRAGKGWISALAADGPALFAASADHCAYAWDIASARMVQVYIGHTGWVRTIIVDGPAKRVYTAGSDCSIKEWDMIAGDCLRTIHNAHSGGINRLVLDKRNSHPSSSPSSHPSSILYSCSDDGLIRAWDMESFQCVAQYEGHSGTVTCLLSVTPHLISGGADHSVKVWNLV
jgi:WD40 repeat protein